MNNNNSATIQGRCYNNVKRPDFTPESISSLNPDEVFVFGSNLQGHHGGGAAYFAMKRFGAIWGQGVGLQGQSYAIPTMQGGIDTIKPYVEQFIAFAKEHREFFFYVTRIGCGIAGFKDSEIAPLFETSLDVENICLPKQFVTALQETRQEPQEVPAELLTLMHGQIRTLIDLLKDLNKQQPIKDCKDAYTRLTELVERNIRYGDEYAFMALRTIWCIMSQQEQEGTVTGGWEVNTDYGKSNFPDDAADAFSKFVDEINDELTPVAYIGFEEDKEDGDKTYEYIAYSKTDKELQAVSVEINKYGKPDIGDIQSFDIHLVGQFKHTRKRGNR